MKTTRRTLLSAAAAAPLGAAKISKSRPSILDDLGIHPVLNFRGTHTVIGASKVWPDLHEAMAQISQHYVVLDELHDRIAERLARLMGTEDAMVTTGAAGGIGLGTCACLTGGDAERVRRLPDLAGLKSEVVIQKVHRNGYDHAVRSTGVTIVEVENKEQLLNAAAGGRLAMMYFLGGTSGDWNVETPVPLADCLEIGRKAGFAVLVDAANMLPPWENLRKLAAMGTDLITTSGGKHMRGPQCSGILAGRRDLVRAARLNSSPFADSHGRPFKVGREEMIGLWLAAERYAKLDFAALDRQCEQQAQYLARELRRIPGLEVSFAPHDRTRRVHRVVVEWDEQARGLTAKDAEKRLLDGDPRVAVLREKRGLMFVVFMNDAGDEKHAARRMREVFG